MIRTRPACFPACPKSALRPRGSYRGRKQYRCSHCNSTYTDGARRPRTSAHCLRAFRSNILADYGMWDIAVGIDGYRIWRDHKGRACITLSRLHPFANSSGYQRLARFLIAESLGYLPPACEHTHHKHGNFLDDRINQLELVGVSFHGKLHASAAFVGRGEDGRFVSLNPEREFAWPREGAICGSSARRQ